MSLRAILPVAIFISMPALSVAADQRLSDLLLRIQRLEGETQRLHGQIELQQHELATLKRRQREQYMDLDARLQGAAARQAPAQGAGSANAVQSDPTETGAPPVPSGAAADAPAEEKQAYRNAFDLLKQRRYEDAIRGFEDLLMSYPNSAYVDNARYWLGEASYVKRDYAAALTQFQRMVADYPLSPKIPAAQLKIGYIRYEKSDWQQARKTLQGIIEQFPDTTEARLAASRLERMTREGH